MLGAPLLSPNPDERLNVAQRSNSFETDLENIVVALRRPEMQPVVAALGSLIQSVTPAGSCANSPAPSAANPPSYGPASKEASMGIRKSIDVLRRSQKLVVNNLAQVVILWTMLACFFIYAADSTNSAQAAFAIFTFYCVVQGLLMASLMIATLRRVPQNNISFWFLIQSWLALTVAFASVCVTRFHHCIFVTFWPGTCSCSKR